MFSKELNRKLIGFHITLFQVEYLHRIEPVGADIVIVRSLLTLTHKRNIFRGRIGRELEKKEWEMGMK